MKKKLKNLFYNKLVKDLSDFNFLLLNSNVVELEKKNCNWVKKFTVRKNKYFLIEPQEIVKNFKQLFRLFGYVKKKKNSFINLNFEVEHFAEIFSSWLNKYNLKFKNFVVKTETANFNLTKMLFSNINLFFSNIKINYKKFFEKNFLIINEINLKWNTFYNGVYKIFSDLNDWKRLMFFFILFKKIFRLKKNNRRNFSSYSR